MRPMHKPVVYTYRWTAALVIAATGAAVAAPQGDERRVEISDDGHAAVVIEQESAATILVRSDEVPYGSEPDWQNDLRVQVGGLQAADVNDDGLVDVIAGCYKSNSYPPYDDWENLIYFNVGGELEANPSWISADEVSTGDIQVAHLNDDPYPDIFAGNGGFAMSPSVIYYGGPDGPSTTPGWSSNDNAWNNYALPVDIDNDGDIDIVTANQGNSDVDPYRPMYMFRNDNGVIGTTPAWQSLEWSIQGFLAAGNFNDDEWIDIAVSKWVNFESAVYLNSGAGLSITPGWTTGDDDSDKGVAWADVDGDGWDDLALGHDPTLLYQNTGGGALTPVWSSTDTYFGHSDIRFVDVDGDGDEDLADIHFSNGHVNIYLNRDGVLDSAPTWSYDCSHVGTAIAFGDINGNGRPDLVVGNSGNPSIMVFYAADPDCVGDLNGDGTTDLADLGVLLASYDVDGGGDLNGDGITDLADLGILLADYGCGT